MPPRTSRPRPVTLSVPAGLAGPIASIIEHIKTFQTSAGSGRVDFAEAEARLGSLLADTEGNALAAMLGALDPASERIEVAGLPYRRMDIDVSESYTGVRGTARVQRGLYRQEGVRNGPTIVPMELLAGIVLGRYTPCAAKVSAVLAAEMPSRSADLVCRSAGILPHSRAAQERLGVELGARWEALRPEAEAELVAEMELPESIVAASVAVDRISLAMAEPRTPTSEDVANGIKHPTDVNYRMAFVGAVTLYDKEGDPVSTVRYAHLPEGGASEMEASFSRDLASLLARRSGLRIVTLADGAHDMQGILDRATANVPVAAKLVDYWHLVEHLGQAIGATDRYVADVLGDWKEDLLHDDAAIDRIEVTLRAWEREYAKGACPPELHSALTYISNHRERLRYATPRAAGLPIGSGTVEATGKAIVQVRMKRPGARWRPAGAQAIMGLRALATSAPGRWDAAVRRVLDGFRAHVKKKESPRKVAKNA